MFLACGRKRSGGLCLNIRRQAVTEDGCGNWKLMIERMFQMMIVV